ncbi:MAG: hypothetical protein HXO60_07155 [Rothia mucilaginosa]|uniref:DUF7211 domain-containing protein n=1 Tax=Rothia mucilaginosa TaxID=43675 RepID=UPI001CAEC0EC|nr:hypothetical protein [Rothia mucilaginosa]MBF1652262.1 hypothetical protein [Rothia mucilaginosa]
METHSSEELAHYGVLGMKWGVRKEPEKSTGSAVKTKEEKAKIASDRAADLQAKIDRKNAEKAAKKAAKKAASGAKKAASGAKKAASGAKKAASAARQKISKASAERAQKKAEAARKRLENQKLREARKAEQDRKKKQRDAERAKKQHEREEKKAAKEAEKQAKLEKYANTPKGGLTRDQRKALPRDLTTTDLIEQNKRLQLEKTNSELKAKLAEYEKANRSQFAKIADTFVSEASSNLTKYAAKKASDILIGAIDSNLSTGSIKALVKEADRATGLSDIVKKDKKKDNK